MNIGFLGLGKLGLPVALAVESKGHNVFGTDACITLLLYKNEQRYWPILKSVFTYLNYLYPKELIVLTEDEYIKRELEKL